jgi:glutathione S-transferase
MACPRGSIMRIYGDSISGNCHKVKWTADYLGLRYDWIETDILKSQSRTPQFLAMNPAGQVPTVVLDDGRPLAQSNAIILHLAEGSDLTPADRYERAKMLEWMFWEQYSHEPHIAVCRFQMVYLGKSVGDLDPDKIKRGYAALARMEHQLALTPFLAGSSFSLADVSLLAYTRVAPEGGFHLEGYKALRRWIAASEKVLGV